MNALLFDAKSIDGGSLDGASYVRSVGFGLYEKYTHLRQQVTDPVFDIIFTVDVFEPPRRKSKYKEIQLNILDISLNASEQIDHTIFD